MPGGWEIVYGHRAQDGSIWIASVSRRPTCRWGTLDEYLKDTTPGTGHLRILGARENAQFILAAASKAASGCGGAVFLGTPAVVSSATDLGDPHVCLTAAMQNVRPSMLGGWHELDQHDLAQYRLLDAVHRRESPRRLKPKLAKHPAWPALSFLPRLPVPAAADVLSEIIDVRWFGCPLRPDRYRKLTTYLGLTPRNIKLIAEQRLGDKADADFQRAIAVEQLLFGYNILGDEVATNPKCFLWRIRKQKDSDAAGLLSACIKGADFIRRVWLQGVSRTRPDLFVPKYFFRQSQEAEAYSAHLATLSQGK